MAKIKSKRVGFVLDLTAMVDVAFLLLTFFMLTTQFKPPEAVAVSIPSSNSEIKLPESNVLMLTISKDGDIYLGVADQPTRRTIFEDYISKNLQGLSPNQVEDSLRAFILTEGFLVQEQELEKVMIAARLANPKMRPIIKADVETNYEKVDLVIQMFRKTGMPTFNLVTSLEN